MFSKVHCGCAVVMYLPVQPVYILCVYMVNLLCSRLMADVIFEQ